MSQSSENPHSEEEARKALRAEMTQTAKEVAECAAILYGTLLNARIPGSNRRPFPEFFTPEQAFTLTNTVFYQALKDEDGYVYFRTPDTAVYSAAENPGEASRQVGALLAEHDWVEICRRGVEAKTTFTVMQRNSRGFPESVTVENWQGMLDFYDMTRT